MLAEKLHVLNICWGHIGEIYRCGYPAAAVTEITFRDDNGELYFVSVCRQEESLAIYVSDVSLYDIIYWTFDRDTNNVKETEKISRNSKEFHKIKIGRYESIQTSEYVEQIKLTLYANHYYWYHQETYLDAGEWLKRYKYGQIHADFPALFDEKIRRDPNFILSEEEFWEMVEYDKESL